MPTTLLILLVLGTIYAGLATPTEAAALGVVGAIVFAALGRRLTCGCCTNRRSRPRAPRR